MLTEYARAHLRSQVVDYMHLVASRNRGAMEAAYPSLVNALEEEPDDKLKGLLYFVKGITLFFNNQYQEAEILFKQIIEFPLKDANLKGIGHMGLGFTLRSSGNVDEALAHQVSALERFDKNGPFKTFLPFCYQSLGEMHTAIHEYSQAIAYFNQGREASRDENSTMADFRFHMGVGGCYVAMKEFEQGKFHLTKAYELQGLAPALIARIENDLGTLYLNTGEYEKAEKLLASSLSFREANHMHDAACTSMTSLSEAYLKQHKTDEALHLLNRCSTLVDKFQTKWKKLEVLRLMARAHVASGNYEKAVECYEQHLALFEQTKAEQERKIFKFKNEQIEKQKQIIADKHEQLAATFEEIKRLKVDRKAALFSWATIIILVVISEVFIDPLIENHSYNTLLSLMVKVAIALLFKPLDGLYENLLWKRTLRKVD